MAGLRLLVCVFLVTFELGQTSVIGETENTAQILKLSKMMVKLDSAVEDIQNDNRELKNDNRQLNEVIAELSNRLENEIRLREDLEKRVRICEIYQREDDGNDVTVPQSSRNTTTIKGKRISGIRSFNGTIAFSAYMATSLSNPGHLRTLIFDSIFTNEGNGYNHHMGVFFAPRTGLYVFTWTIRANGGAYFNTQLLVNGLIYGSMHTRDYYSSNSNSATAVVHVAAGNSVYVRTGPSGNSGDIISNYDGYSTFSGWTIN